MRLPDFLIIGGAKSGTTTLYQYLCRHPQVYMSTPKEPDFFAVDAQYAQGINWYSSLFNEAKPEQVCGEASTTYSRWQQHPQAAERIAQALPKVKLIYIMRHPVDRAYSFYVHKQKEAWRHQKKSFETFEQTIEHQSEFLDSSYYLKQITKFLQFFPQDSFLFLLMEDLVQQPVNTVKKTLDFINVDSKIDLTQKGLILANQAADNSEWFIRQQLTSPWKKIPGVIQAKALLSQTARDRCYLILKRLQYRQWQKKQEFPPAMLPETRQTLLEKYRQPNQQLADFLQRDLSHWNS
jgi:Sulfotransferase domain